MTPTVLETPVASKTEVKLARWAPDDPAFWDETGKGVAFRNLWISNPCLLCAFAAYGAFIIPRVFGSQIELGRPEVALYGFALYYVSCLAVNWWFYARKNAEQPC